MIQFRPYVRNTISVCWKGNTSRPFSKTGVTRVTPHVTLRPGRYERQNSMSMKVAYKDGVFEPVESVRPGKIHTAFSDEKLRDLRETFSSLKTAEKSFDFWNNPADAVYDAR